MKSRKDWLVKRGCNWDKISLRVSLKSLFRERNSYPVWLLAKNIVIIAIIDKSDLRYSSFLCRSKCLMFTSPLEFPGAALRELPRARSPGPKQ